MVDRTSPDTGRTGLAVGRLLVAAGLVVAGLFAGPGVSAADAAPAADTTPVVASLVRTTIVSELDSSRVRRTRTAAASGSRRSDTPRRPAIGAAGRPRPAGSGWCTCWSFMFRFTSIPIECRIS